MKIARIEPIQLKVPTRRMDPDSWLMQEKQGMCLTIDPDGWAKVPMVLFDTVVLRYTLNHGKDLEDMRTMVSDAKERLKPGGVVLAIARACDSGQELAERMVQSGVRPDQVGVANLSNSEILRLSPGAAVLLTGSSVFRPADSVSGTEEELNDHRQVQELRFRDWVDRIRQSSVAPDIRFQPERLAVRLTDIGLLWRK